MPEMISRDWTRMRTRLSVMLTSGFGQMPVAFSAVVARPAGMIRLERGRASRFVSRKWRGMEWKYIQASGAVVTWHEKDIAAEFHIHLTAFANLPSSKGFPGHMSRSQGYMNAMPVMAA